ncbi:caspase, EACC1-associated type [Streptodolium elevatio]|uniref:NACHT domain-containing protein n=1 Tax=Streptodolium elevatio TaxID=3157996 RepID=A0ABV3DJ18_9ACTN
MTPGLHDPRASRAVLIGTHTYDHLTDLPAVAHNLRALRTALTDPLVWGLPDAHCTVVEQPGSADDVLETVAEAASAASDLLLVYLAGHGLLSPVDDGLDLALRGSRHDQRFRRLGYESVRGVLRDARHIRAKAVVLDCCFAGRAIVGAMGPPVELAAISQVEGTYLLAAASATEAALAPPGETYTAFTGELLDILANGIAGADAYLDFAVVHDHLSARLAAKGCPRPQQRNDGHGSRIVLARNRGAVPEAEENGGLRGPLRDLLVAQQRAASKFPYRLYGAPSNALATVYVRQQTRAYVSERDHAPAPETDGEHRREFGPEHGPDDSHVRPGNGPTAERHVRAPGPRPSPTRSTSARPATVAPLRLVDEALALHRHLLILGGPGQGKSTLTLQLASTLAAEFRADGGECLVPLRVTAAKLADLDGPWNTRVERALTDELGPFLDGALPPDLPAFLPAEHTRLLIVDGLDEITNPEQRRAFIAMLGSRLQDEGVPYRLLITSRPLPRDELEFLNQLALGTYTLEPFSREQLAEFAGRWFGGTPNGRHRAQSFLHQIGRAGVRELSRVPLLATIAAIVFREGESGALPTSRFRLYEQYFAYLDRDQTAMHHKQKARILDDLKYAHAVHVQSVSYLFSHLRELVEHLAESVVNVRDADAEPRDLLRTALAWLDGQGCRPTRLQLPQWPTLVATFLGASGLFVLQGDRLRFVHYTFAEHIAADVRAAGLPVEFDPEDAAWSTLLDEAQNANMQAWAVVVHHSNMHASGDAILTWLNGGGTQHQALAGTFLANGIEADERHASRFVDHVLHRLANLLPHEERRQIVSDIAAMVQYPEMRTAIDRYLREGYRTYDMQIAVAEAIGPDVPRIVEPVLHAAMRDTDAAGSHRAAAARELVDLAPHYFGEAVQVLRGIVSAERSTPDDRRVAAAALGSLDPGFADEAAGALRGILASQARLTARVGAAVALAGLGPNHVDEAAAELQGLATVPEASCEDVVDIATALAELGAEHAVSAAELLRAAAHGRPEGGRMTVAAALPRCGSAYRDEAARMARETAASPDAEPDDREQAAALLDRLGHTAEAAALCMAMAREPDSYSGSRRAAAVRAAQLDVGYAPEAAELLWRAAVNEDDAERERAASAAALASLGTADRERAVALLRAEMTSPEATADARIAFATALGKLSPAYTAEATRALLDLRSVVPALRSESLAAALADLGAQNTEPAAALLRTVIGHPDAHARDRASCASALAELASAYLGEAAVALRENARAPDSDGYARVDSAVRLAGLAPRHTAEAAAMLAAIVSDDGHSVWVQKVAAEELSELDSPLAELGVARLLGVLDQPHTRAHAMVSTARAVARLAPQHAAAATDKLRERMGAPDTPIEDIAVLGGHLAQLEPDDTERFAEFLRGVVREGETTPYARRCAVQSLGGLGLAFHDEAVALGDVVASAADVPNEYRWMVVADRSEWGPRYRHQALQIFRAARSDRTLSRRERFELARKFRDLGTAGQADATAVMFEVFTDADSPRWLRHLAAREVGTTHRGRAREVVGLLRRAAADVERPVLARVQAIEVLAFVDPDAGAQAAELLPELLESTSDAAARIDIVQAWDASGRRFGRAAAETVRAVLADATADPAEQLRAASVLLRIGPQHQEEAATAFRGIVTSTHASLDVRTMAAYRLADIAPRYEGEGLTLLLGLGDEAGTAQAAVLVAGRLEFLGGAHGPAAAALFRRVARDVAAPAYLRGLAAGRLAYHGRVNRREAKTILRGIVAAPDTPRRTRRRAAVDLGQLGASCAAEAADVLFGMAAASPAGSVARRAALRSAALIGHAYASKALAELDALGAQSPSYCHRPAPGTGQGSGGGAVVAT